MIYAQYAATSMIYRDFPAKLNALAGTRTCARIPDVSTGTLRAYTLADYVTLDRSLNGRDTCHLISTLIRDNEHVVRATGICSLSV